MLYLLVSSAVVFTIILTVIAHKRQKKQLKELEEKIHIFHSQIETFFTEYLNLKKQYVSESTESIFVSKWQNLYSELAKFHISQKHNEYEEIAHFRKTYANLHDDFANLNAEIKRKEALAELLLKIADFFTELFEITKVYVTHANEISFIEKWQFLYIESTSADTREDDEEFSEIGRFKTVYESLHNYFETANNQFIQNKSIKHDALFSNIDGKSLDEQQRTAVINDEDRILVLAGAGSGKTLTISAKVKYLCEVKNVNPNEILLISFTKKSAEEMTERIRSKLHIPAVATTFHKLGLKRQRLTPL